MAASVGWIINEMGIHFPGMISQHPPLTFAELGTGYEAWENVPLAGKLQILAAAGLIEAASEMEKPVRVASARASCGCSDRTAPRFKSVALEVDFLSNSQPGSSTANVAATHAAPPPCRSTI